MNTNQPKPLRWLGSSREDLKAFPEEVQWRIGGGLWDAQVGLKARFAKRLKGFGGASVLELMEDFDGDTYRAVYTVRFAGMAYVLHAFQKKSKRGIATPKADLHLIEQQTSQRGLRAMARKQTGVADSNAWWDIPVTEGSGNVFADLEFPDPEEALTKAQLASHIRQIIKQRRLTQTAAAKLMGIDQPKVSALLNGRIANFSSERLMRLLTSLGQDVEITIRATPRGRSQGQVRVVGTLEL